MDCASVALVCLCLPLTLGSSSTFIQTNRDLLLTVTEEGQNGISDIFHWRCNGTINIIRLNKGEIDHLENYINRVEFFQQNLSLILKNVQLSDSGIYTAEASGNKEETLSTHDVIVQAPPSPVSVKVDSVSNPSESCNFTVSCRTELSPSISRSFTWDRHTCVEARPPTPGPAPSVLTSSLQLSLTNERIICNHSNQVSWTQDTKTCREICPKPVPPPIPIVVILGILAGILCGLGAVVGGAFLYRRRQKNKTANTMNVSYEVSPVPPAPQPEQSDADPPNPTYSLVVPHTGPASPPRPDDVYAQVNKPSRSTHKT